MGRLTQNESQARLWTMQCICQVMQATQVINDSAAERCLPYCTPLQIGPATLQIQERKHC